MQQTRRVAMRANVGQAPRMTIRIETFAGDATKPYLPALGRLRREVFRAWPYLYEAQSDTEWTKLSPMGTSTRAGLVVAFDGDEVVGCASCLPMQDENTNVTAPFLAAGIDPKTVFYFGESVLRVAYRGQGIGVAFFTGREAHARSQGAEMAAFCSVRRPEHHPLKPADAKPLDTFWRNRGYAPLPGAFALISWKQVDGPDPVENILDIWTKRL